MSCAFPVVPSSYQLCATVQELAWSNVQKWTLLDLRENSAVEHQHKAKAVINTQDRFAEGKEGSQSLSFPLPLWVLVL